MKNTFTFLFIALSILFLSSCKKDDLQIKNNSLSNLPSDSTRLVAVDLWSGGLRWVGTHCDTTNKTNIVYNFVIETWRNNQLFDSKEFGSNSGCNCPRDFNGIVYYPYPFDSPLFYVKTNDSIFISFYTNSNEPTGYNHYTYTKVTNYSFNNSIIETKECKGYKSNIEIGLLVK